MVMKVFAIKDIVTLLCLVVFIYVLQRLWTYGSPQEERLRGSEMQSNRYNWQSRHALQDSGDKSSDQNVSELTPKLDVVLKTVTPIRTKKKIVLFTSYRSGSSFVGELFRTQPQTYYMFEPLMLFHLDQPTPERLEFLSEHAEDILSRLLNCSIRSVIDQSQKLYNTSSDDEKRNRWIQEHFPATSAPGSYDEDCRDHLFVAVKIIKAPTLDLLMPLLARDPAVHVVHLVRDPRGSVRSIMQIHDKGLSSTEEVAGYRLWASRQCSRLATDLPVVRGLPHNGDRYRLIRYEDVAYHPLDRAERILQFLDLPFGPKQRVQITHLTQDTDSSKGTYSTRRNSTSTAENWIQNLSDTHLEVIQSQCAQVIQEFGYGLVRPGLARNATYVLDFPGDLPGLEPMTG